MLVTQRVQIFKRMISIMCFNVKCLVITSDTYCAKYAIQARGLNRIHTENEFMFSCAGCFYNITNKCSKYANNWAYVQVGKTLYISFCLQ